MRGLALALSAGEKQLCMMKALKCFVFFNVEKLTDVSESDGRGFEGKQQSGLADY